MDSKFAKEMIFMKTIAILSGKGGVGKSSITASLAVLLSKRQKIVAVDCDVDAPNLALVLGLKKFDKQIKIYTNEKAELIPSKCDGCKKCLNACNFSAIGWAGKRPVFDKLLCEGCGACELVCPKNAIVLKRVQNASIGIGKTKYGFPIVAGQLKIGESGSGKIVAEVKNEAKKIGTKEKADAMLVDSPPGISCPMIASVRGSDYVIAITEPTPPAFNDLKRALGVVEHFRVPYGLIINRCDLNKRFAEKIEAFASKYAIDILGKIPYDRKFVDALVNLKPIVVWDKKTEHIFLNILNNIKIANLVF